MKLPLLFATTALTLMVPVQEPRACDLVDATAAQAVIGGGLQDLNDSGAPSVCMYMSEDFNLTFQIQVLGVEMFDATPIHPRTPVEIGDEGRYNVGEDGTAIVQFRKGDYSVRMSVQAREWGGESFLDSLLDAARTAADRMPAE